MLYRLMLACASICTIDTDLTQRQSPIPCKEILDPLLKYLEPLDATWKDAFIAPIWLNHVSTWKATKTNQEVVYIRAAGVEEPYVPFDDMTAIIQYVEARTTVPVQKILPLPPSLSSDFIVTAEQLGAYMPQQWPSWNGQQRETFLQDFADVFVELANCGIPPALQAVNTLHQSENDTVKAPATARDVLMDEITVRFAEYEPQLESDLVLILDALIAQHPDRTSESLDRFTLDQNDFLYAGGNILVNQETGRMTGFLDWERATSRPIWMHIPFYVVDQPKREDLGLPLIGAPEWVWRPEDRDHIDKDLGQAFMQQIKSRDEGMYRAYEDGRPLRELVKAIWAEDWRRDDVKKWVRVMKVWTQRKARTRGLFTKV